MAEDLNPQPNSYEELILRSIEKYNAMPFLNIPPESTPETKGERTTKIYLDWGKAGNPFLKLIKKKNEYWDPDQNLSQLGELNIDQYCTNFEKEDFNPYLALDYTNSKQEEYAKQSKAVGQKKIAAINSIESKTQAYKRTLWDTKA